MKPLILAILAFLARSVIARHKPFVIGVTGTVGKTTTTSFIADFLSVRYPGQVLISDKAYNGEFGLPLTILRLPSGESNPFLWIWILIQGIGRLFQKTYPRYLVLEYGVDRVGEMAFQCNIARPDIAVILGVAPNHLVNFPSFSAYRQEKMAIAKFAKRLIVNADDLGISQAVAEMGFATETLRYSAKGLGVDINAVEIASDLEALSFTLRMQGQEYSCHFPVVGTYQVANILPVFCIAQFLGIDPITTRDSLSGIHPQKGRGSLLSGVNDSIIIDGSYNGGVTSILGGIDYLDQLKDPVEKWVLLGDMRELGTETEEHHTNIAHRLAESSVQKAFLVGPEMKKYVEPILLERWGSERVYSFLSSRVAGSSVHDQLIAREESSQQVVTFVKGSQNTIYLEEAVKAFLADIRDASKLCRQ